jgi:hypothetical protein
MLIFHHLPADDQSRVLSTWFIDPFPTGEAAIAAYDSP